MTEIFDLRADLAEVPRADDNAYFTTNLALLAEVRKLRAADSAEEGYEERLAVKEAELKAATYTVEMVSVPRRRKEEIYEEALDKFQAKLSFIANHVDEKTQFQRGNWARIAIVAAGVQRIISPSGAVQDDPESIFPTIEYLHDEAPDYIFEILEKKSQELNAEEDKQDDLHKEADF
jgi:hypothetical protein